MNERRLTWKEQAQFIDKHLSQIRYKLAAPTIVSIWFEDDPDGEHIMQLHRILTENYGAYHTGPTSNVPGKPNMWSFGFRTLESLNQARRVFPLPAKLEAGPPIYINGI